MSIKYYITENNIKNGPFTVEELKSKGINKDSFIWHEGLDDWIKASEISSLSEIIKEKKPKFKTKYILIINIIVGYVFYLFAYDHSSNPFGSIEQFIGSVFEQIGAYIIFYIALLVNLFKKISRKNWIIIIIVSWIITIMATIGNNLGDYYS